MFGLSKKKEVVQDAAKDASPKIEMNAANLSATLMRLMLGSVDVEKMRFERQMSPGERDQYEQTVAAFYPTILEPTIKRFIASQERMVARGASDWRNAGLVDPRDQLLFARGTMNGLMLILEEFQQAFYAHVSRLEEKQEKFDPHELFPDIFDLRKSKGREGN